MVGVAQNCDLYVLKLVIYVRRKGKRAIKFQPAPTLDGLSLHFCILEEGRRHEMCQQIVFRVNRTLSEP